jgi:hypothetical protein
MIFLCLSSMEHSRSHDPCHMFWRLDQLNFCHFLIFFFNLIIRYQVIGPWTLWFFLNELSMGLSWYHIPGYELVESTQVDSVFLCFFLNRFFSCLYFIILFAWELIFIVKFFFFIFLKLTFVFSFSFIVFFSDNWASDFFHFSLYEVFLFSFNFFFVMK